MCRKIFWNILLRYSEREHWLQVSSRHVKSLSSQTTPPNSEEISSILKMTRNKFVPGLNGLPYLVYKNCEILLVYICKFFKAVWDSGNCPPNFGRAVVKLIPKVENCDHPSKIRPTVLAKTHGQFVFFDLSKRLNSHLEKNDLYSYKMAERYCLRSTRMPLYTLGFLLTLWRMQQGMSQIFIGWLDLEFKMPLAQWIIISPHYYKKSSIFVL